MTPRISLITLGVSDLTRSLHFYRDGLGLPTTWSPDKGVIFFKTAGTVLALYPYDDLAKDASPAHALAAQQNPLRPPSPNAPQRFTGVTLAHNVHTREEVDTVIQQAAGAIIVKPPQPTFWGGYAGYFSDPDGYLWEIAHGAFPIREDGSLDVP